MVGVPEDVAGSSHAAPRNIGANSRFHFRRDVLRGLSDNFDTSFDRQSSNLVYDCIFERPVIQEFADRRDSSFDIVQAL